MRFRAGPGSGGCRGGLGQPWPRSDSDRGLSTIAGLIHPKSRSLPMLTIALILISRAMGSKKEVKSLCCCTMPPTARRSPHRGEQVQADNNMCPLRAPQDMEALIEMVKQVR